MSGFQARRVASTALVAALLSAGCASTGERAGKSPGPADGRVARSTEITQQQLVGLDADQIGRLLGPADFRRDDGPVELWQYRATDCVLDLYLYNDAVTATWRVEHAAARDISATASSAPGCVTALLHARAAG